MDTDVGLDADTSRRELVAAVLDRIVVEWFVLEVVDVDVAVIERDIRRRPVGKFDNLDIEALGLGFGYQCFYRIGLDARNDAHLECCSIGSPDAVAFAILPDEIHLGISAIGASAEDCAAITN